MDKVVKVNKRDKVLGLIDKLKAHKVKGVLHRAFSILVVNDKGEILLQQRSKYKLLWPLYWSNTCCSHPDTKSTKEKDEKNTKKEIIKQAEKRLKEEMGFTVPLKPIGKFQYQAQYRNVGSENEIVTVLLGQYGGEKIRPNPKEAADYKWVKYNALINQIKNNPGEFTPWLPQALEEIKNGK